MQPDVIADPIAMVVKLVCTPVTVATVLRIFEDVRVADYALEVVIAWVEVNFLPCLFVRLLREPLQSYCRIGRITRSDLNREKRHQREGNAVNGRKRNADPSDNFFTVRC